MSFSDIIRRKRDGGTLTPEQITEFVSGLGDNSLPADQIAAMAMAICINSLDEAETASLTSAMAHSGEVLDWTAEGLAGPVVDKHSTGGVGDKVSLMLAPIVAACGAYVPMISGAGLGHTGGTLDKLSSIPGYDCFIDRARFMETVRTVGCAIIGQTGEFAPADRRLYAIRDVTATVESDPLICASILSKKCAAGLEALVMDVKYGTGAFMSTKDQAERLAAALIGVGARMNLPISALITDMNQVLGSAAGNAVEILETIAFLKGEAREPRLLEVTLELAADMLRLSGLCASLDEARAKAWHALDSGAALARFAAMVEAQGGPADLIECPDVYLSLAPVRFEVVPEQAGTLAEMDAKAIGYALVDLGAGRRKLGDAIDPGVGFVNFASLGDVVGPKRPICVILARTEKQARETAARVLASCRIGQSAQVGPVVASRLAALPAGKVA